MYRVIIILLTLAVVLPTVFLLYYGPQIEATYHPPPPDTTTARSYFDSLTPAMITGWIERSKKLMDKFDPQKDSSLVAGQLPPELQTLNVLRVNVDKDAVAYVWTPETHTELLVTRLPDQTFQVIAQYDDATSKVVWPQGK